MQTVSRYQVHKFGGSSLANVDCIRGVASIIQNYSKETDVIVISAIGKTTNLLIEWVEASRTDTVSANRILQNLRHQYLSLVNSLLNHPEEVAQSFVDDTLYLSSLLDKPFSEAIYAEVVGHGEIWSTRLVAAYLNQQGIPAVFVDARDFMVAERTVLPKVRVAPSKRRLQPILEAYPDKRLVITGFISRNAAGETVLLGRNGSDYSATQIAELAEIENVTIWSDVAGVYSADPRYVKNATLLPLLRLDEANELARLGAPVLHSRTLQPVKEYQLKLQLRSSLKPNEGTTRVEHVYSSSAQGKIVTFHNHIGWIELVIPQNQVLQSWLQRFRAWMQEHQLDALVEQFIESSRTLRLVYTNEYIDTAFMQFKQLPLITDSISIRYDLALLAIVGAGVCQNSLQMLRFSQMLKTQPLEFMWQSEDNISVVAILRQSVSRELLRNVHDDLFRAHKTVGLVVLGKGEVAKTWVNLFRQEQEKIAARSHFDFSLIGIVSSQKAWLDHQGLLTHIKENNWDNQFEQSAREFVPDELIQWMSMHPFDELVILDFTNSDEVAAHYADYAKYGFHVISANKRAAAFDLDTYHQIEAAFLQSGSYWLYNATVGGGLPINTTIHDLVESGDTILSIEGTFSSTLAWLFYQYDGSVPFSMLLEQAWQQGMTERDPREDLCGLDALRKLLIVARTAGYDLDRTDVKVEPLIPEHMLDVPLAEFFEQLHEIEPFINEHYHDAKEEHGVLRYVVRFLANGQSKIGLEICSSEDPIGRVLPGENLFLIRTLWYRDNPLVIHGPSAGVKMTAGAIQADLNRLVKLL
ncbi:aspartate kinase [Gallibacterium genomosp. 3]|uniref:Bifunctional aspartokinase/homoserine dehydrogenase n=1 Tax=Gallibacterium genomosp. 3 TaxID=505345 RepID=A0A1A7NNC3_9PAST|nr:bifunctional aspartate kinase/homoserine dehydrogenase II [Gallibacterium genomosp. 3]OBW91110.1 aspartate kinase [Gallibacterium genomosp. 3]